MAARLALVNLAKESMSPEVTTVDTKVVRERILNIVTRHHSGIFKHLLPECYNEQYGEALPHNWERLIEEIMEVNQEKGVGGLTILCRVSQTSKVKYILFVLTRVDQIERYVSLVCSDPTVTRRPGTFPRSFPCLARRYS